MNHITTSLSEKITRKEFDKRIRAAKELKLEKFFEDNGYYYCEDCKKNSCKPIDCSHDISVDRCIKDGVPELAYDVNNITLRGRECHKIWDNNLIKI
jgi:hypothetical protein